MWDHIRRWNCSGILVLSLSVILLFSYSVFASDCADSLLSSPEIAEALLSDQWDQIFTVFSEAPNCSLNSSAALLYGHAALAVGYHNVAAALFVLIQDSTQLEAWHTWTGEFSKQHPAAAVAHYLFGDAKARLADFDGAMSEFNLALENTPSYFMARNARGVLNGIMYQAAGDPVSYHTYIEAAINDFEEVNRAHPIFADALVNKGVACIESNLLPGAKNSFNQVIQVDPKCAMAYNGRAMLYLEYKNLEDAQSDIVQADSLLPNFPYILWNAKALTDSSDTTSAIGQIAWIKGKGTVLDSTRGFQWDQQQFAKGFDRFTTGTLGLFGLDNIYNMTMGSMDMIKSVTWDQRGGIYFDVQIRNGTHRVGTNYALAYPRSKE